MATVICSHKDGGVFLKNNRLLVNAFWNVLYKLLNIFIPLVFSIYSARVFMPEGVGKIALAQNIATYFVTLAALGIPNYGTKKIASFQSNYKTRNRTFNELFLINFISSILCTIIYYMIVIINNNFQDKELLMIFGTLIAFNSLNLDWLYQGIEEYGYITIRSIFVKILSMILLFIFVQDENDIYFYALILCFSTMGNYFFNIFQAKKYVKFQLINLNLKQHIKPVLILFASTCATEIYTLLDSTMVGFICGETALGYYSNASKIVRMVFVLMTSICAVFLPRLSLYYNENKAAFTKLATMGLKIVLYLAIPAFFGVMLLSDIIVPVLFGNAFLPASTTLRILSPLIFIFSFAYITGHIILIICGKEKIILYAAISGAIINFVLNFILINLIGMNGAAISSMIAESIVTIILFLGTREIIKYKIEKSFFISITFSNILMILTVLIIKKMFTPNLSILIIGIAIGGVTYVMSSLVLKNKVAIDFVKRLTKFLQKEV